jgi:hypothetical protein
MSEHDNRPQDGKDWLTKEQEAALSELNNRLRSYSARHPRQHSFPHRLEAERDCADSPETYNVFGIHGARGAGKSTLLRKLYCELTEHSSALDPKKHEGSLVVLPPLDCSSIPPEITPGVAVLVKLGEYLKHEERLPQKLIEEEVSVNARDVDIWPLSELIGLYARTEPGYRELFLDLSTTPDDYARFSRLAVTERMQLGTRLRAWLQEVLRCLERNIFIIPLDDFDLVPAAEVRRFLRSLLDELQQERLVFVVTADFPRLQHLSWDPRTEFDDKTGRALLDKLLPRDNRVHLLDWTGKARREYIPLSAWREQADPAGGKPLQIGKLLELEYKRLILTSDNSGTRDPAVSATRLALLLALLPGKPRGLETLYRYLEAREKNAKRQEGEANTQPQASNTTGGADPTLEALLERIAACRAESLLARRFQEVNLVEITGMLRFVDLDLSVEQWDSLVEHAADLTSEPLKPLAIAVEGQGFGNAEPESIQAASTGDWRERLTSAVEDIPEAVETQWGTHDPLRHEALERRPLRDAAVQAVPYWTELILHVAFEQSPRRCTSWIDDWSPLKQRTEGARFQVPGSRDRLRALLDDDNFLSKQSALYWLEAGKGPDGPLSIGWQPMIRALRGAREPLSFMLGSLLVGGMRLDGELPTQTAEDLLPSSPRALILLVDALQRCPWSAFMIRSGWDLATYVGLSAALVRTAYIYSLCRLGAIPEDAAGSNGSGLNEERFPNQSEFVRMLETRNPGKLLRENEESVNKKLAILFEEDMECLCKNPSHSISTSLTEYLNCQVYKSVKELISERSKLWESYEKLSRSSIDL